MMMFVTGVVGIVMMVGFLGFLVWWIKALPFTLIVVGVVLLLLYDFVQTVRYGNSGAGR
jgi:hypothetical protein